MNLIWVKLIEQVLKSVSPQFRQAAVEFVNKLDEAAKKTDNPWDDIFVGILKFVLVIP